MRRRSGEKESGGKSARQKVLEIAADRFYRDGIRAVGVEAIVKEAGVAKISLYRGFASKDDLIVAYLEQRNADFWRKWDADFARCEDNPQAQLKAVITYLANRTTEAGYRGCPFINYCAEFPERAHPGRKVAEANKREWRRRLLALAERLGAPRPKQLADGLLLLVEGAYAISQTLGDRPAPAQSLVWAAQALVAASLAQSKRQM